MYKKYLFITRPDIYNSIILLKLKLLNFKYYLNITNNKYLLLLKIEGAARTLLFNNKFNKNFFIKIVYFLSVKYNFY